MSTMLNNNCAKRKMMNTKYSIPESRFLMIIAVLLILSISSCSLGREEIEYSPTRYFVFDPITLLDAIYQNEANSFVSVADMPPDDFQPITVNWKQSDYEKILAGLLTNALHDNLNDWQLSAISFSTRCEQYSEGFQGGNFTFFKNAKDIAGEFRMVRIVNITAWNKTISVSDKEYRPNLTRWSSLDLPKTKITAEQALIIAEQAGGNTTRLSVENNCTIVVSLMSNSPEFEGWWIRYDQYSSDGNLTRKSLLEIEINSATGKPSRK